MTNEHDALKAKVRELIAYVKAESYDGCAEEGSWGSGPTVLEVEDPAFLRLLRDLKRMSRS